MILIVLGVFCAFIGVWALSTHTRGMDRLLKTALICLAGTGFFLIWYSTAEKYPVVLDEEIHIKSATKESIAVNLVVNKVRDCRFQSLEAFVVDKAGKVEPAIMVQKPAPAVPSASAPPLPTAQTTIFANTLDNLGEVFVLLPPKPVVKVFFKSYHTCPFNFEVETEFGHINLEG